MNHIIRLKINFLNLSFYLFNVGGLAQALSLAAAFYGSAAFGAVGAVILLAFVSDGLHVSSAAGKGEETLQRGAGSASAPTPEEAP